MSFSTYLMNISNISARHLELVRMIAVLFLLVQPLFGYDFSLKLAGPQTATPGFPLYLQIQTSLTEGERMWVNYESEPFEWSLVGRNTNPAWGNSTYSPVSVRLRLEIPADARPGAYTVRVTAESGGVVHTASMLIDVEIPETFVRVNSNATSSADIQGWRERMIQYGSGHCDEQLIKTKGTWEGNIWYYDGDRVYQQIAEFLGDKQWLACAGYSRAVYRDYVLSTEGRVQGYRVFPHGLAMEGSSLSRTAVELLSKSSAFAANAGGITADLSRETAYLVSTYLRTGDHNRGLAVSFALGHLDQWSRGIPYQPFMVGLTMESLIEAYEATGDPRIPSAIKKMLDQMWEEAWVAGDAAFVYWTPGSKGTADLNMLIAPAYAWFYRLTGDAAYLQRGDKVFNGGVAGAWLAGGKQFSQNYRWSFKYVEWATGGSPPPTPTVTPTVTPTPTTNTATGAKGKTYGNKGRYASPRAIESSRRGGVADGVDPRDNRSRRR